MGTSVKADDNGPALPDEMENTIYQVSKRGDLSVKYPTCFPSGEAAADWSEQRTMLPTNSREILQQAVEAARVELENADVCLDVNTYEDPATGRPITLPVYVETVLKKGHYDNLTLLAHIYWSGKRVYDLELSRDEALEHAANFWRAFHQFHYFLRWTSRASKGGRRKGPNIAKEAINAFAEALNIERAQLTKTEIFYRLGATKKNATRVGPYMLWLKSTDANDERFCVQLAKDAKSKKTLSKRTFFELLG